MTSRAATMFALLWAAGCGLALAHSSPTSLVKLDFLAHAVRAEVLVPESELAFATAAERAAEPFADYLQRDSWLSPGGPGIEAQLPKGHRDEIWILTFA